MADFNQVEKIMAQVQTYSTLVKYGAIALLVAGGWYVTRPATHDAQHPVTPMAATPVGFTAPAAFVPQAVAPMPAPAASSVTFVVASVGRNRTRTSAYLNSQTSYKLPGNQSIELAGQAATYGVEALVGKTVSAVGNPKAGYPSTIVISDPAQLQVR